MTKSELSWEIARLEDLCADRLEQIKQLQAQIDRLMLEFCPAEMTPEQLKEWGKHQKPSKGDI